MHKYLLILFVFLSGCQSTQTGSPKTNVVDNLIPKVWVEENRKTGWFDLKINMQNDDSYQLLTSKFKLTNPVRTKDGELVAYISHENEESPELRLQNIYIWKSKKLDTLDNKSSTISFSQDENFILVTNEDGVKEIPINRLFK